MGMEQSFGNKPAKGVIPPVEKKKSVEQSNASFTEGEKTKLLENIDAWTKIFEGHVSASVRAGTRMFGAPQKIERLKELRGYVEKGERKTVPLFEDVEKEIEKVINKI